MLSPFPVSSLQTPYPISPYPHYYEGAPQPHSLLTTLAFLYTRASSLQKKPFKTPSRAAVGKCEHYASYPFLKS